MRIDSLFPSLVGIAELDQTKYDFDAMTERAIEVKERYPRQTDWRCNTYSTMDSFYEMLKDDLYKPVVEDVSQGVIEMAKLYGVEVSAVDIQHGWLNVAEYMDYQEYHTHAGSHFSVIVYINTPENCGNVVFRTHEQDMLPLPIKANNYTDASFKTHHYQATRGGVVIFRSNMYHMVEQNLSKEPRISMAINFKVE
jgi:uncharacterized protein (TIGR02466 family)